MRNTPMIGSIAALAMSLVPACKESEPPYDHYCRLYEEAPPMTPVQAVRLAQRAERELPRAAWKLLAHGHYLDDRYRFLKAMAKEDGRAGWECAAIEKRLEELKKEAEEHPQPGASIPAEEFRRVLRAQQPREE